MQYSKPVLENFSHPKNVGQLEASDPDVISVKSGSKDTGAIIQLQIKVNQEQITHVVFKAYGNPYIIAAMSLATVWLKQKTLAEIATLNHRDIVQALEIPATKIYTAIMVEDIIKQAFVKAQNTLVGA